MLYRYLGQKQTEISALGIGAMSFSDFYGKSSTEISHSILSACLDLGINHVATADIYGMGASEERIGSFLGKNPSARNFFKIASKGSIRKTTDGKTFFDNSKKYLTEALNASLQKLGVEPLSNDFTIDYLQKNINKRSKCIKNFLMDQSIIAGIGNIYASEILYRAKVHPLKSVDSLNKENLKKIIDSTKYILRKSINVGGTSIKNHLQPDGKLGYFVQELQVYGKQKLKIENYIKSKTKNYLIFRISKVYSSKPM